MYLVTKWIRESNEWKFITLCNEYLMKWFFCYQLHVDRVESESILLWSPLFFPKGYLILILVGPGRMCRSQGLLVNALSSRELYQASGNVESNHWYLEELSSSVLAGNSSRDTLLTYNWGPGLIPCPVKGGLWGTSSCLHNSLHMSLLI